MKKLPIVLTGCSGGIGSKLMDHFSLYRWPLIGLDQKRPSAPEKLVDFHRIDLSDSRAISALCKRIGRKFPKLWGVIHCAGVYPIVSFDSYSVDLWNNVVAVNMGSAFHIVQGLHPKIVDGGRVVLVASGASHCGSSDIGYSASKAGLVGLAKSLAKNLAPRNILVNSVCPGPVTTRALSNLGLSCLNA